MASRRGRTTTATSPTTSPRRRRWSRPPPRPGVDRLITVGCDVASSEACVAAAGRHDGVWATAGVHPHDASSVIDDAGAIDLGAIEALLDRTGSWPWGSAGSTTTTTTRPASSSGRCSPPRSPLAHARDLALVIHTREAWDDTFAILAAEGVPERTVFHCFTGGPDEARRCLDLGASLSFSGIVTFPSAPEVRDAAARCARSIRCWSKPIRHIWRRSRMRGRRNRPEHVALRRRRGRGGPRRGRRGRGRGHRRRTPRASTDCPEQPFCHPGGSIGPVAKRTATGFLAAATRPSGRRGHDPTPVGKSPVLVEAAPAPEPCRTGSKGCGSVTSVSRLWPCPNARTRRLRFVGDAAHVLEPATRRRVLALSAAIADRRCVDRARLVRPLSGRGWSACSVLALGAAGARRDLRLQPRRPAGRGRRRAGHHHDVAASLDTTSESLATTESTGGAHHDRRGDRPPRRPRRPPRPDRLRHHSTTAYAPARPRPPRLPAAQAQPAPHHDRGAAPPRPPPPRRRRRPRHRPSGEAAFLACVRQRESGGNYGAVSPDGLYRGAYQFHQAPGTTSPDGRPPRPRRRAAEPRQPRRPGPAGRHALPRRRRGAVGRVLRLTRRPRSAAGGVARSDATGEADPGDLQPARARRAARRARARRRAGRSARTSSPTPTRCAASPGWPASAPATASSRSAPGSARSPSPWPRPARRSPRSRSTATSCRCCAVGRRAASA